MTQQKRQIHRQVRRNEKQALPHALRGWNLDEVLAITQQVEELKETKKIKCPRLLRR